MRLRRRRGGGLSSIGGRWSATLLALLACHAHCGTGERHQTILADGVAADLADSVGAVGDPFERVLGLIEHVARVIDDRHLLVALERRGADVGLVAAGALARVT